MDFKNVIDLPTLIRHGVTGLVFILCYIFLPLSIINISYLAHINNIGATTVLLISAFSFGVLLDSMKIYRNPLSTFLSRRKFIEELSMTLSIDRHQSLSYLSKSSLIERRHYGGDLFLLHSKLIMTNSVAFIFFSSSILWFLVYIVINNELFRSHETIIYTYSLVALCVSFRMYYTGYKESERLNKAWILFCKEHSDEIKAPLQKMTEEGSRK